MDMTIRSSCRVSMSLKSWSVNVMSSIFHRPLRLIRRSLREGSPKGRWEGRTEREWPRDRSPRRREDNEKMVINIISAEFSGGDPSHSAR